MTKILDQRRLGIFVIYDKEGIVDEYVVFLLRSLMPYLSGLVIVCNGGLQKEEYPKLKQFTERIVVRENLGCDVMAWKKVLCSLIEQNGLAGYDEILLCNDSFYGPIVSWKEMFQTMNRAEVDFWGITRHPESYETVRGYIPEHLQSFFLIIRKRMFCSMEFFHYWNEIELKDNSLLSAILAHELRFTEYFASKGFRWKAYIEPIELEQKKRIDLNYNTYYLSPLELVRNYRCPIIKRKALTDKNLQFVAGEEPRQLLTFVERQSDYPVSLIWDNLIRTVSKEKLYDAFHMHYVVSKTLPAVYEKKTWNCCIGILGTGNEIQQQVIDCCKNIQADVELFEKPADFERFLVDKKYDMAGVIDFRDDDVLTPLENILKAEDLIENMLESQAYAEYLFQTEPYLGVLYPLRRPSKQNCLSENFFRKSFWCRGTFLMNKDRLLYGTICSKRYAEKCLCNYNTQFAAFSKYETLPDIFNREDVLQKAELMEYVQSTDKFYIYGTGIYGRRLYQMLAEKKKDIIAFVVSDGQPTGLVEQVPVISFSEFCQDQKQDSGLIVALSKKIQLEVKSGIEQSGLKDVYYV